MISFILWYCDKSFQVIRIREVIIFKEVNGVMAGDVSPLAMFLSCCLKSLLGFCCFFSFLILFEEVAKRKAGASLIKDSQLAQQHKIQSEWKQTTFSLYICSLFHSSARWVAIRWRVKSYSGYSAICILHFCYAQIKNFNWSFGCLILSWISREIFERCHQNEVPVKKLVGVGK